jgi:hypothetical protein
VPGQREVPTGDVVLGELVDLLDVALAEDDVAAEELPGQVAIDLRVPVAAKVVTVDGAVAAEILAPAIAPVYLTLEALCLRPGAFDLERAVPRVGLTRPHRRASRGRSPC